MQPRVLVWWIFPVFTLVILSCGGKEQQYARGDLEAFLKDHELPVLRETLQATLTGTEQENTPGLSEDFYAQVFTFPEPISRLNWIRWADRGPEWRELAAFENQPYTYVLDPGVARTDAVSLLVKNQEVLPPFDLTGDGTLSLILHGEGAGDGRDREPRFAVFIGDRELGQATCVPGGIFSYAFSVTGGTSETRLRLKMLNPFYRVGEERRINLRAVRFERPARLTAVVPRGSGERLLNTPLQAEYQVSRNPSDIYASVQPVERRVVNLRLPIYADRGREVRRAYPFPAGTRLKYEFPVPSEGGRIVFDLALLPEATSQGSDPLLVAVTLGKGGKMEESPEHTVRVDGHVSPSETLWRTVWIDLGAHAGQTINLTIEAGSDVPSPRNAFGLLTPPRLVSTKQPEKLNVILVSMDTLRWDRLGCYGFPDPRQSPRIDAVAQKAAVFWRAYTQSNWTLPAHASLFTGLYASSHGVRLPAMALTEPGLTMAEVFREAGYHTRAWTDGAFLHPRFGLYHGFEAYSDSEKTGLAGKIDAVTRWMEEAPQPFFLFLHTYDPHVPYRPRKEFLPSDPGLNLEDVSPVIREFCPPEFITARGSLGRARENPISDADLRQLNRLYNGCVRTMDHDMGVILDALEKNGMKENTILIFTSDHGEGFMEHGLLDHGNSLFDEMVRIPLIIRIPGKAEGMKRTEEVELVDLLPTLSELLGLRPVTGVDGQSFAGLFDNKTVQTGAAISEGHHIWTDAVSWVEKDIKTIFLSEGGAEVYDLQEDPGEMTNLAPERKDFLQGVRDRLAADAEKRADRRSLAGTAGIDPESERELGAMGYGKTETGDRPPRRQNASPTPTVKAR